MKSSPMTIGQVADHFALPTHVLRHWESQGLLFPARAEGARRRYTRDDLYRVASIVRAKQAGLSLGDIRAFMAAGDSGARKEVLRRNQRALRAKMAALRTALDLLDAAVSCSHEDLVTCPYFRAHLAELVDAQEPAQAATSGPTRV